MGGGPWIAPFAKASPTLPGSPFCLRRNPALNFRRWGVVIGGMPAKHPVMALLLNKPVDNLSHFARPLNWIAGNHNTIHNSPEHVKAIPSLTEPLMEDEPSGGQFVLVDEAINLSARSQTSGVGRLKITW